MKWVKNYLKNEVYIIYIVYLHIYKYVYIIYNIYIIYILHIQYYIYLYIGGKLISSSVRETEGIGIYAYIYICIYMYIYIIILQHLNDNYRITSIEWTTTNNDQDRQPWCTVNS